VCNGASGRQLGGRQRLGATYQQFSAHTNRNHATNEASQDAAAIDDIHGLLPV
jgi:hypothetical protein